MWQAESKYAMFKVQIETMYASGMSLRRICTALAEAGCVKPDPAGLYRWVVSQSRLKAKVQKRARQLAAGADGTSDVLDPVLKATADALLVEIRKSEGLVVSQRSIGQKPKKVAVSAQASTVAKRPSVKEVVAVTLEEEARWGNHLKS